MTTTPSNRTIAIVAAALVVAAALGYWGYSSHKKKLELQRSVVALMADTSVRLRDALGIEIAHRATDRAMFIKKLDEHAAAADHNLQALKRLGSAPGQALVDAADDYLLTTREILKKQLDAHRYRLLLADSSQALLDHMRADNRTGAWIQEAVKAKERVNKDYRGYSLAAGALDKLLDSFAASQAKIVPHVAPAAIIPETLAAEARRRARDDSRQAALEFEKLQQPGAAR
ncbi:MAG: hypothetical protein HYY78_10005 [Betaproteobacteria bacterium]|nr:hypothetical protein [Betaproteobacteria bacterium]